MNSLDSCSDWIINNQEEVQKYKGQRIAVHPIRGIVASHTDLLLLYGKVKEMGLLDEVIFDSVPL